MSISKDSQQRKNTPIFSGVMRYFPDALAAVARVSKAGNDKHNPGEPLHWARDKSTDHGDCIARHQIEFDGVDEETGEFHAAQVAWRALAQLQLLEESRAKGIESIIIPITPVSVNTDGTPDNSPLTSVFNEDIPRGGFWEVFPIGEGYDGAQ